jgi:hypothetical protein
LKSRRPPEGIGDGSPTKVFGSTDTWLVCAGTSTIFEVGALVPTPVGGGEADFAPSLLDVRSRDRLLFRSRDKSEGLLSDCERSAAAAGGARPLPLTSWSANDLLDIFLDRKFMASQTGRMVPSTCVLAKIKSHAF